MASSNHLTSLALTLGVFGEGEEAVDDRKEDGANTTVTKISSEASGPAKSPSDDDDGDKSKKRKKYHRHTAQQIHELEALFKESPHPDESQRQQLSKRLGLHPRQVKFWFQNRRMQIKAIQERHENSLLKSELDTLRDENKLLREMIKKDTCSNCGSSSKDATTNNDEQQLRVENAKLKAQIEMLRRSIGKHPQGTLLKIKDYGISQASSPKISRVKDS